MTDSIVWTDEHRRKLLSLKNPKDPDNEGDNGRLKFRATLSFAEVSRRMNEWFNTDEFTKDAVQKQFKRMSPLPDYGARNPAPRPTPYLDQYFDERGKPLIPQAQRDVLRDILALENSGRWYKTLVLSDTQGVFADDGKWQQAIGDHPDADIIMVPGDVADWEGASKYIHEMDYPLKHEADWLVRFYHTLSEAYPDKPIIVTNSNHRRRVEKAMRSVPQGLLFLAEHNPERHLAQPFPNIAAIEPWWVQLGDTIYAHKEGRTSVPGDNARDAIKTFRTWRDSRQFVINDFRVVVTGHSHKVAEFYENGFKGMEPGCLARVPMLYMTSAEIGNTQDQGYAYVVQKGGRADRNESRCIKLGGDD
jgi:hypothetical protein